MYVWHYSRNVLQEEIDIDEEHIFTCILYFSIDFHAQPEVSMHGEQTIFFFFLNPKKGLTNMQINPPLSINYRRLSSK